MANDNITIVGAGIDGIMTALYMAEAGLKVRLVAKTPDPRKVIDAGDYFASSWNGQDTRYVTLYEGHPYLRSSPMYPDMKAAFEKPLTQGGWLGKFKQEYNDNEKLWLAKREAVTDNEGFYREGFDWYVASNRLAMDQWAQLKTTHPFLFAGANVKEDIVRIYDNPQLFKWAEELHRKDGVLLDSWDFVSFANSHSRLARQQFPHLEDAINNGEISGVLLVEGFSFDVKRFMLNAINYLENKGAEIMFDTEVTRIVRNPEGEVTGLEALQAGKNIRIDSQNYSLHMGAYDVRGLLKDTPAEGAIAGMEGRWAVMDAPADMEHSLKLHGDQHEIDGQPRPVIDQNHAIFQTDDGKKALIGFGYLFSGFNPKGVSFQQKVANDVGNHAIIKRMFPSHYAEQEDAGRITWVERGCVRACAYNDLPRNDKIKTVGGGYFIVNGGDMTGAATKSPTQALINLARLGIETEQSQGLEARLAELHRNSASIIASSLGA